MNLQRRITELLKEVGTLETVAETKLLGLLQEIAEGEKKYILILRFDDTEEMDTFTGGLSDGFGEGFVDIHPKQREDGTFDWTHCNVENISSDYMDDDDYDDWSDE